MSFQSLVDIAIDHSNKISQKDCFIFLKDGDNTEVKLTFAELDNLSRKIASLLQSKLEPGDRVLINHLPGIDYITSFFGCLYAGMVAVPVYPPRYNPKFDRLSNIVSDAKPKLALTTNAVLQTLSTQFDLEWVHTDNLQNIDHTQWKKQEYNENSLAYLQYTSGSTSSPKGVMISHGNIVANLKCITDFFEMNQNSVGTIWLPPYHDMGLIGGILESAYLGVTTVLMSPYSFVQRPLRWLKAISKYKATVSGGPNFAYELCVRRVTDEQLSELDLSSWELAFCGAEPIRKEATDAFTEKFAKCGFRKEAFYPCYGLAEATLMVSGPKKMSSLQECTIDSDKLEKEGLIEQVFDKSGRTRTYIGCGTQASLHEIKIVNPETFEECKEGTVGEIWFNGPSNALGYWQNSKATEESFRAKIKGSEKNYMRTGDLGFVLQDHLYIAGRIKDLIIFRGRNYYPQDIELTVEKSHESLKAGACAAFTLNDETGEKLVIVQELQRGIKNIDLNEVITNIKAKVFEEHGISPHAISLISTNSIPLTSSGKIQRHAARTKFLNKELEEKARFEESF